VPGVSVRRNVQTAAPAKSRVEVAEIERGKCLEQMDGVVIAMAPKNGGEPAASIFTLPGLIC
jgi:hypothetical protein